MTQSSATIRLSSITSYRDFTTNNREDEDGTNRPDLYFDTNNREHNESFYQELRLSGSSDKLDWLIGASYFDERADQVSDTFALTDSINTTLGNVGVGTIFTDLEYGLIQPFDIPATLLGHGWREAWRTPFRALLGNAIAIMAAVRALGRYQSRRRTGHFTWDKTAHAFPTQVPAE